MDTEVKSLNVTEEDKDEHEEGGAGPPGEPLFKQGTAAMGLTSSPRNVASFNKSVNPFVSVSLSKAGSPCDIKPQKPDKKLVWEGGKTSEETPVEEDGQYDPPGWSAKGEEDDDKKKDVKKSLFTSAELSKAIGPKPVVKPVPAPTSVQLGYTPADLESESETSVYKPLKFDPKKHVRRIPALSRATKGVKKSITELRYGSQLSRVYDIGKSCGVCGRLSKSCGGDDHAGHSGCCEDCKKSMNSVQWHQSHLS